MHFDGSHITICNMFNAHRSSHIAHRTSHIHMLMFINIYVCCHEVYLSNEVARWNQSAHCKCNGKGIKGKISNRNNVVFLNSHRITRNAHEIRNNVHIIIILWYSRANKTLIHNALQCHINFFSMPSKCKQLSEQLKCTLQINFCKIHLYPDKMLYYKWKPFWEFIVLHCTNEIYHIASLALCGSEKEIQGMGKNCVKHLKKVARK